MTKILVYDSDARFREVVKAALTALGYEAVVASDGYSMLPLAQQHQPRLVIVEYKLPEVDGFEILQRLRKAQGLTSLPIIFASVTPKFEIEMAILDTAAVGYIDKPLDALQLKDAVEALIGKPARPARPAAAPSAGRPTREAPPPAFNGEPDLDGTRDDVIELD